MKFPKIFFSLDKNLFTRFSYQNSVHPLSIYQIKKNSKNAKMAFRLIITQLYRRIKTINFFRLDSP